MNVLFICNQNQNRSKIAEKLFKDRFNTRSAGLYNDRPVSRKHISWADTVIVMEDEQRAELARRFPKEYMKKKILCANIPDVYDYKDPKLDKILTEKINNLF